ncbi:MAG: hypothetical protein D6820_05550, partial [Lentisphaerae bacterium]
PYIISALVQNAKPGKTGEKGLWFILAVQYKQAQADYNNPQQWRYRYYRDPRKATISALVKICANVPEVLASLNKVCSRYPKDEPFLLAILQSLASHHQRLQHDNQDLRQFLEKGMRSKHINLRKATFALIKTMLSKAKNHAYYRQLLRKMITSETDTSLKSQMTSFQKSLSQ